MFSHVSLAMVSSHYRRSNVQLNAKLCHSQCTNFCHVEWPTNFLCTPLKW